MLYKVDEAPLYLFTTRNSACGCSQKEKGLIRKKQYNATMPRSAPNLWFKAKVKGFKIKFLFSLSVIGGVGLLLKIYSILKSILIIGPFAQIMMTDNLYRL